MQPVSTRVSTWEVPDPILVPFNCLARSTNQSQTIRSRSCRGFPSPGPAAQAPRNPTARESFNCGR